MPTKHKQFQIGQLSLDICENKSEKLLLSAEFRILRPTFYGKSASNPEFRNNPENFHPCSNA